MLGFVSPSLVNLAHESKRKVQWKKWLEHVMKKKDLELRKGALVYLTGKIAAKSEGFSPSLKDLKEVDFCLRNYASLEFIHVQGVTYVVKTMDKNKLVAFNGAKYIIAHRTKHMLVIVLCESKLKSDDASYWIGKVASQLRALDY